ncbi:YncE family protein [Acidicapsa dinghuensis]|uniref:YncE family protein n=1 Tax=Acidicapsa dinghuensis TaxID=2218256 RepID=A0ABW1EGJ0_9BACT|nr:YncE family protein [Acidicapsa dinghuensis]
MSRCFTSLFSALLFCLSPASALHAQSAALVPVRKYAMPSSIEGKFDHLGIDVHGHRLFAAAEAAHQVLVFDLDTGKYLRSIDGIPIPHAIFVRQDLDRIYITDGGDGAVRIYDGRTYRLLKKIPLKVDADSIGYDPQTKYLYIDNGGGDAHETYSMLSIIDTTAGTKVADIKIDGDTLEAMTLEAGSERMFVNDAAENKVVVLNRRTSQIEATWPVTLGKRNVAMALDQAHNRLFVACRDGKLVIFDTQSGKELQVLPIGGGVDDAVFDPATERVYVQCGKDGSTWIYQEKGTNQFTRIGHISEGTNAKNSLLAPQMNRYYVIIPPTSGRGFIDAFSITR